MKKNVVAPLAAQGVGIAGVNVAVMGEYRHLSLVSATMMARKPVVIMWISME